MEALGASYALQSAVIQGEERQTGGNQLVFSPVQYFNALTEADMMIYLGENSLVVDTELNLIKLEMRMISLRQAIQNIKWIWKKYCQIMFKGSKKKIQLKIVW